MVFKCICNMLSVYFQWVIARERFQQAADLIDAEQRMKKSMWGQFWSAHQRFFKYLCIASKVKRVVQLAREEIKNGKVSWRMSSSVCAQPASLPLMRSSTQSSLSVCLFPPLPVLELPL